MASASADSHSIEDEVLDAGLTPADLQFALAHLRFGKTGLCSVRIDRDVAAYLLDSVRHQHGAKG